MRMPTKAIDSNQCRYCGSGNAMTIDSRPADRPSWRRRRKQCADCNMRWSTIELPVEDIESLLAITYKLDDLGKYALSVHAAIETLKNKPDMSVPEPTEIAA